MVASHSGTGKLSTHYRTKCDEVIEAIKKTNGYVGVCTICNFLQGTMDIRAFLDHIEYIARTFGADHVAIGTDRSTILAPVETAETMPLNRPIWEKYWSPAKGPGDSDVTQEQFHSLAWTNWPLFTVGLVQRGFSDAEIQKIIGGNVLRVCRDSLA